MSDAFKYMGYRMPYQPTEGCVGRLIVIEGPDGVGRSTQGQLLKNWLEVQGYGVMETGWSRSKLIGEAITDAKKGHSLNRLTYSLMYASDLADRLEYQIIPALRSGFIVLADRYVYTAIARGIARASDPQWLLDVYGFAIQPDFVVYLQLPVQDLVRRVLMSGTINYWESGMDMNYGDDMYDSFVAYQTELTQQLDRMAAEHAFKTIDARLDQQAVHKQIRRAVGTFLKSGRGMLPHAGAETVERD